MNRTVKCAMGGGVFMLAIGVLPTTQASPVAPDMAAFKGHTEISDRALNGVRGSYISADQILYFGVEMYTQWQSSSGTYGASLNIGIDRSVSKVQPTVTVTSNVNGSNGGNGTAGTPSGQISSGGLKQVQGVTQVVQTTGNSNRVANTIGLDVVTQRPATAGSTNSAQAGGNKTFVDNTGATARTYVNANGAGVTVTVPMHGSASQSVASVIGMQQQAQVYSDANTVQNQLNMVIQVQPNTASSFRTSDLLQAVRGQ